MRKRISDKAEARFHKALFLCLQILLLAGLFPMSAGASAKGIGRYLVKVDSGYLALRTAMAFDASNEKAKLYTGDQVAVMRDCSATGTDYCYVYSYDAKDFGYVNQDYLVYDTMLTDLETYTVKVDSGYLALRSAKAFDASNEVGKLYTGDEVQVLDKGTDYWAVHSWDLFNGGFVNKDYLTANTSFSAEIGGISKNLYCNNNSQYFSTSVLGFDIPDSWMKGFTYVYSETNIEFYTTSVKEASGLEDGFICEIFRSTTSGQQYEMNETTYLGCNGGYYYYLRQPTDFRANPNDTVNCQQYRDMCGDVSYVIDHFHLF